MYNEDSTLPPWMRQGMLGGFGGGGGLDTGLLQLLMRGGAPNSFMGMMNQGAAPQQTPLPGATPTPPAFNPVANTNPLNPATPSPPTQATPSAPSSAGLAPPPPAPAVPPTPTTPPVTPPTAGPTLGAPNVDPMQAAAVLGGIQNQMPGAGAYAPDMGGGAQLGRALFSPVPSPYMGY